MLKTIQEIPVKCYDWNFKCESGNGEIKQGMGQTLRVWNANGEDYGLGPPGNRQNPVCKGQCGLCLLLQAQVLWIGIGEDSINISSYCSCFKKIKFFLQPCL